MKNLPKEQIFQLKSIALDAAVKTKPDDVLAQAQLIYNFLTSEIDDMPVAQKQLPGAFILGQKING